MDKEDVDYIWHERRLDEPENAEHIEKFVGEHSAADFYIEQPNMHGFRYIHRIGEDEKRTDLGDDLIMVENKDTIVFYSETTRIQSTYWIMKRRPGCFELIRGFYPQMFIDKTETEQNAIEQIVAIIRGNYKMSMKEYMEYEGTREDPFIIESPFDPAKHGNKTPFGPRVGGDTVLLKPKLLEALLNGRYVAIDVEREYVAFLKLDDREKMGMNALKEALNKADIPPKENFDALEFDILINNYETLVERSKTEEYLDVGEYVFGPEALETYVDDMIASEDIEKLSRAITLMKIEILELRKRKTSLEERCDYLLQKYDAWEERARTLYRELHGKDAPPQGG